MAILKPCPVSTDLFTYLPQERAFIADESDLGQPLGQVYDDAADLGLTLVSRRTGREMVFRVSREERDSEGELLFTELEPANASERHTAVIRLFND